MKAKTLNLLNLIKAKKAEIRKQKFEKAIHEHAMRNHRPLTREEEKEFQQMIREGNHLLEIDRRADEALNKDVNNIHKHLFGY